MLGIRRGLTVGRNLTVGKDSGSDGSSSSEEDNPDIVIINNQKVDLNKQKGVSKVSECASKHVSCVRRQWCLEVRAEIPCFTPLHLIR